MTHLIIEVKKGQHVAGVKPESASRYARAIAQFTGPEPERLMCLNATRSCEKRMRLVTKGNVRDVNAKDSSRDHICASYQGTGSSVHDLEVAADSEPETKSSGTPHVGSSHQATGSSVDDADTAAGGGPKSKKMNYDVKPYTLQPASAGQTEGTSRTQ